MVFRCLELSQLHRPGLPLFAIWRHSKFLSFRFFQKWPNPRAQLSFFFVSVYSLVSIFIICGISWLNFCIFHKKCFNCGTSIFGRKYLTRPFKGNSYQRESAVFTTEWSWSQTPAGDTCLLVVISWLCIYALIS